MNEFDLIKLSPARFVISVIENDNRVRLVECNLTQPVTVHETRFFCKMDISRTSLATLILIFFSASRNFHGGLAAFFFRRLMAKPQFSRPAAASTDSKSAAWGSNHKTHELKTHLSHQKNGLKLTYTAIWY